MRKVIFFASAILFSFGCASQQKPVAVAPPKPKKKDELKVALKKIADRMQKLQELEHRSDILPVKVGDKKSKHQQVKKNVKGKKVLTAKKKTEKLYTFVGTNMSLASAVTYTFGSDYSISFDDGVNVNAPVTAVVRNLPVKEACNQIVRQAGYVCSVDRKHRIITVKSVEEAYIQLPAGFESYVIENELGGDILKGSQSSTTTMTGVSSTTGSSGISSGSKVSFKNKLKKEDVLNFFKSFLTNKGKIQIDWNTNILYVRDVPSVVEAIKRYVAKARKVLDKQVYIKARLMLVLTSKDLESGVDWQRIIKHGTNKTFVLKMSSALSNPVFSISYTGDFTNAIFQFLSQIGDVREILAPEIRTLNLVPALIVRGSNEPYVNYNPIVSSSGLGTTVTMNTQISFAFNGIQFYVKPYVQKDKIFLTIQPSISSVDGYKTFTDANGNPIQIPRTSITSEVTKLVLKSNSTIVMGGLVWDGTKRISTGVPILDQIPIMKLLFRHKQDIKNRVYVVLSIYAKEEQL